MTPSIVPREGATGTPAQLLVYWRSHKADQMGEGSIGAQSRVAGHRLCPVGLYESFLEAFPERGPGGPDP